MSRSWLSACLATNSERKFSIVLQHPQLQVALEERHLIEENQLGVPLGIYPLKAKDISYTRFNSWFTLLGGSVSLLVALYHWHVLLALSAQPLSDLQQEQLSAAHFSLMESLVFGGCLFLVCLFLVLVRLPIMKKRRVIVCENGLLLVRGRIRGRSVDVVRWAEIGSLVFGPYPIRVSIHFRGKERKPLNLREDYEHFDELVAQIRQYSHVQ